MEEKLALSEFCWNMGGILETDSNNLRISSLRVDPTVGTDSVKETPIELAAKKDSTELLTLFAEFQKSRPN